MFIHTIVHATVAMTACVPAFAQDGHHGHGHDQWHSPFYSTLMRPGTKTSCCNLTDCRPTSGRVADDRYEVMLDGDWIPVPWDKVIKKTAPDMGFHVCAPKQQGMNKGALYCVVLPPEI